MIKSTLQASLLQLLTIVFDLFNKHAESILGKELYEAARAKHSKSQLQIFQTIKDKGEEIAGIQVFSVAEDFLQNLATALFIHVQANYDTHQAKKQTGSGIQASSITNTLVGGMMGTISNQHVWNFKPSLLTKCSLLDLLAKIFEQTSSLLLYFPRISKIFEKQLIPTLVQMLKNIEVHSQYEAPVGIRVIKCLCTVVSKLCSKPCGLLEEGDTS